MFGASTGAAAALVAAAKLPRRVGAVVSRGGRPDLAGAALEAVRAPTLLIVGGADWQVIELNEQALARLRGPKTLEIVPGASHLFPEPGALEAVIGHAADWFERYLAQISRCRRGGVTAREFAMPFRNRTEAGQQLAAALNGYQDHQPAILALPRGGVPVAAEVAAALKAPLDLILVRKIGVPFQPELAMGAVVDGSAPDRRAQRGRHPLHARQRSRISRPFATASWPRSSAGAIATSASRRRVDVAGRTAIVIDDGIATGATIRAALRATRARSPKRLVLAVPVAPTETIAALRQEADDVVCLEDHEQFGAIGYYYADFSQVSDREVIEILARFPVPEPAQDAKSAKPPVA